MAAYLLQPDRKRSDLSCRTDLVPFTAVPASAPLTRRAVAAREVVPLQR